jgi:hypothetical protein
VEHHGTYQYIYTLCNAQISISISLSKHFFVLKTFMILLAFFFFPLFSSTGVWTQGLHLLSKHSTTWPTPLILFALVSFLDRVSCFCPGCPGPQSSYFHFHSSQDYRHALPYLVCLTFCLGWPQILIFLSVPSEQLGLQVCTNTPGPSSVIEIYSILSLFIVTLLCNRTPELISSI